MVIKEWNEIKLIIVQKSFKKCGISNNLNGMEDDYLIMDQSNSDREDKAEIDDVPEDITVDKYDKRFMK